MALQLVPEFDYCGPQGVQQLDDLRQDLANALREKDWPRVRRLDKCCATMVDKVIAANDANCAKLLSVLNELTYVYASAIRSCQKEVATMAV